jgi:predicted MFS family arabinose efflux permease
VTGSDRLFTTGFVLLTAADLGYFTAIGVAVYALPLYVTGPLGSDEAAAGLAFGAFAVSALVLRPLAGMLTDRLGRRPLLVGGGVLCAIGMALTAFADSLPEVVALRLLLGVAEAAFFVAGFAAVADLASPARTGEAISYNSLGLYLGLALGPPLAEFLVEHGGFTAAWLGAAVLSAVAAVLAGLIGETRAPRTGPAGPRGLVHRAAIGPSIGFFTSLAAIGGFLAFVALHSQAVGLGNSSTPLLVYGLVVVVSRVVFAKVPDRVPSLPLAAAGLAATAVGLGTTAAWPAPLGLITGTVLLALGVTFSTPAFFSAVFATAGPAERGAASGTASAFMDLGLGGGPIVLGLVAQSAGIPWALATASAISLAGCAWTLALNARRNRLRA